MCLNTILAWVFFFNLDNIRLAASNCLGLTKDSLLTVNLKVAVLKLLNPRNPLFLKIKCLCLYKFLKSDGIYIFFLEPHTSSTLEERE